MPWEKLDPATLAGWSLLALFLFFQYGWPWLKGVLKWHSEREKVQLRLKKEGYDAVITDQQIEIKELRDELSANRELQRSEHIELKQEVSTLRKAEADCRVEQGILRTQLASANECIQDYREEIDEMKAEMKRMKSDSKSRVPSIDERNATRRAHEQPGGLDETKSA